MTAAGRMACLSSCRSSPYGPLVSVHQSSKCRFQYVKKVSGMPVRLSPSIRTHVRCVPARSSGRRGLSVHGGFENEPFWLSLIKDVVRSSRSLAIFLAEQPSQLKYIEWPTFQDTLKTATLTLVLVAILIVALSTVDSSLCYVLAMLLRKTA